jgi:hypothetical protein
MIRRLAGILVIAIGPLPVLDRADPARLRLPGLVPLLGGCG